MSKCEQSEQMCFFAHHIWNRQKFVLNNQATIKTERDQEIQRELPGKVVWMMGKICLPIMGGSSGCVT